MLSSRFMFDLGILGGGQLARMSVMAAERMGISVVSLDPDLDSPAAQVGPSLQGDIKDPKAIAKLMESCRRVTFENEFIPADTLLQGCEISGFDPSNVIPGIETLRVIQDKLLQREAYARAGIASPKATLIDRIDEIGFPAVLKARFGGYDGRGTRFARTPAELDQHKNLWSRGGWMAEEFVPFTQELAVMVAISGTGVVSTFPTMVTEQVNHVCDLVYPSDREATDVAIDAVKAVGGVGLFGVELFALPDGTCSINEIAPRPHNTGHYTLDWGGTSQFEQHVRVAAGLPIDPAPMGSRVAMVNLLGLENSGEYRNGLASVQRAFPQAHVHWYGKRKSVPGRKMGHINLLASEFESFEMLRERALQCKESFYEGWRNS